MITTAREYFVAQQHLEKFAAALKKIREHRDSRYNNETEVMKAAGMGVESMFDDIRLAVEEYEYLTQSPNPKIEIRSFRDIGKGLIKARLVKNYTRGELATILGLQENQIKYYEENHYQGIGYHRLQELLGVLDLNIPDDVVIPNDGQSYSLILEKLGKVGVSEKFVQQRLVPAKDRPLIDDGLDMQGNSELGVVGNLLETLRQVFNWNPEQIVGDEQLRIGRCTDPIFSVSGDREAHYTPVELYAIYAIHLAGVIANATTVGSPDRNTFNAATIKEAVIKKYGDLTFTSITNFAWDNGISVLPIQDDFPIRAMYWWSGNKRVVLLNFRPKQHGQYLFDLLRCLYFATIDTGQESGAVIDLGDKYVDQLGNRNESSAFQFAANILLDGRYHELSERCMSLSGGETSALHRTVPAVARKGSVHPKYLAVSVAYDLSLRGIDWWSESSKISETEGEPYNDCLAVFYDRFSFLVDDPIDNYLVQSALEEPRLSRKEKAKWKTVFQKFMSPRDCLSMVTELREQIGSNFHVQSGLEFVREAWILGMYGSKIGADEVRIYPESNYDGEVMSGENRSRVEVTEIMDANRRRGEEYRQRNDSLEEIDEETAQAELRVFPGHFRRCISNKVGKNYPEGVGLLIYLNTILSLFHKSEIRQIIEREVKPALRKFGFVDVLWGDEVIRFSD